MVSAAEATSPGAANLIAQLVGPLPARPTARPSPLPSLMRIAMALTSATFAGRVTRHGMRPIPSFRGLAGIAGGGITVLGPTGRGRVAVGAFAFAACGFDAALGPVLARKALRSLSCRRVQSPAMGAQVAAVEVLALVRTDPGAIVSALIVGALTSGLPALGVEPPLRACRAGGGGAPLPEIDDRLGRRPKQDGARIDHEARAQGRSARARPA